MHKFPSLQEKNNYPSKYQDFMRHDVDCETNKLDHLEFSGIGNMDYGTWQLASPKYCFCNFCYRSNLNPTPF